MAQALPPDLSRLLDAAGPPAREEAWTQFVGTYSRLLLHTARSLAPQYDAAMDAYTYVLEELRRDDFRRLRAYVADSRSKFSTWLVVVARRLCLDHYRQRYGRARGIGPQKREARAVRRRLADLFAEEIDPARLAHPGPETPETEFQRKELWEALEWAVKNLSPRDRLLLALRFEEDLSAREIAELMGFPTPFHVYRRLNSLFESIRQRLKRRGLEGTGS